MLRKSECGPVCRTVRLLKETSTAEKFKGTTKKPLVFILKLFQKRLQCICMCSRLSTNFSCINSFHARSFALFLFLCITKVCIRVGQVAQMASVKTSPGQHKNIRLIIIFNHTVYSKPLSLRS